MAKLNKKERDFVTEYRKNNPSKELDNLLIEFSLNSSVNNKKNIVDFVVKDNPTLREYADRQEMYRLLNREKAKLRYRERDIDIMRRTIANTGGFSRLDIDRNFNYHKWLNMNVRNDFSKMSMSDLEDLLWDLTELNNLTKYHDQRVDFVLKGKILQYLISEMRGASEEYLAELRKSIVQYVMAIKKCGIREAEEIFDEMYDEMNDDYLFSRSTPFTEKIASEFGRYNDGNEGW